MKTTISVIKADIGSVAGHLTAPQETIEYAEQKLRDKDLIKRDVWERFIS